MERVLTTLLIVLVVFVIIIFSVLVKEPEIKEIKNVTTAEILQPTFQNINYTSVSLKVPAVDNEGKGVTTILKVQAQSGEGRILTDINNLLFWVDTQYSIRVAQKVAQNITKINISNIDLIYTIETNASLIEGPSAGAALTVATVVALENRIVNESVMVTGTVSPDGKIGPVGEILAKAKASKDVGAKLFLVPKGQGTQTYYKPIQQCERIGVITYCTTEYKAEKIDITKDVGIEVREVSDVQDALKYFLV